MTKFSLFSSRAIRPGATMTKISLFSSRKVPFLIFLPNNFQPIANIFYETVLAPEKKRGWGCFCWCILVVVRCYRHCCCYLDSVVVVDETEGDLRSKAGVYLVHLVLVVAAAVEEQQ